MTQHMFGVHHGKLTARQQATRRAVAKQHGVTWIYTTVPGTGAIAWFECANLGDPFDRDTAATVLDALHAIEPPEPDAP